MFSKKSEDGYTSPLDGVRMKTVVFGEKTLMSEFFLEGGKSVPSHEHPYEQTGYLVSGKIKLNIGIDSFLVKPGDSWCIPENVPHGAGIIEDSLAIEVFSPVREDYLP